MKYLLGLLLLLPYIYAISWADFVRLPPDEKYSLMANRLKLITNGSIHTDLISKTEAVKILNAWGYVVDTIQNSSKKQEPRQPPQRDCSREREMDWALWCWNNPRIDCVNANKATKNMILDNIKSIPNSFQYKCLYGK